MPGFTSTYVGNATRGFYFTCPVDCVITGLQAPNEASQPAQVVEVLDLGTTAPAAFPATTAPVGQLFYDNAVPAGTRVSTSVALQAGRVYGIFGCATASAGSAQTFSSYGNGEFSTTIQGNAVVLRRLVTQSGIASNGGNQPCSASTGSIGRVLVDIEPAAGLYPSFELDVATGPSPLTVQFTDTSTTNDPGGVTSWAWDFDNDGTIDSTAQNPSYQFMTCGDFDVSLTVSDATNPPATELRSAAVRTDLLDPGFQVALLSPPNVWQFTDTSSPTPTAWAWDFDHDGTVDSTLQNPTFPSVGPCLDTTVRLTVTRDCRTEATVRPVFRAAESFFGPTAGGNGTTSLTAAGNYFDIEVTNPGGIRVCGLAVAPHTVAGPLDLTIYVTEDTFVGKAGNAGFWRLASTGTGVSAGGTFLAPILSDVALDTPFLLPAGNYGIAVFLSSPSGMGIAYTNGPGGPFVGADLVMHPSGEGAASTTELGNVVFEPRLFNGGFYYARCSVDGEAARGFYGTGCPGALGVPQLDPGVTEPALGTTYQLDVTNVPNGLALMFTGLSKTTSIFGPLPLDGAAFGAPGCQMRASSDVVEFLLTATNTATWTLPVPNDPTFLCLPIFNQAAVLSNGTNALGFVLSDAWAAQLGN